MQHLFSLLSGFVLSVFGIQNLGTGVWLQSPRTSLMIGAQGSIQQPLSRHDLSCTSAISCKEIPHTWLWLNMTQRRWVELSTHNATECDEEHSSTKLFAGGGFTWVHIHEKLI